MSSLQQFTEDLKKYVGKAQEIEKSNPHKASQHYLKICDYIMAYIKHSDVSEDFRQTMKQQVKNIIKKVEEIQKTPNLSEKLRSEIDEQQKLLESQGSHEDMSEIDFEALMRLPDVPTDESEMKKNDQKSPSSNQSGGAKDEWSHDFNPNFMKEVSPSDYKGTIIPLNQDLINEKLRENNGPIRIDDSNGIFEKKGDTSDIKSKESNQNGFSMPTNFGFVKDKLSVGSSNKQNKDPLANGGDSDVNDKQFDKLCFACGAPLGFKEKICNVCGAQNKE